MTVADDLATLRSELSPRGTPHHEMPVYMQRDQQRVNAAHVALARVEAEIARLERCVTMETERSMTAESDAFEQRQRALAAEAEVARLRDGLRPIREAFTELDDLSLSVSDDRLDELRDGVIDAVREVLAEDGAA